jgi:hypothetical protein
MGAVFARFVPAPMTSVLMLFEMTQDYAVIVPLMISNLVSLFVSSRLQRQPIYEALAVRRRNLERAGSAGAHLGRSPYYVLFLVEHDEGGCGSLMPLTAAWYRKLSWPEGGSEPALIRNSHRAGDKYSSPRTKASSTPFTFVKASAAP